MSRPLTDSVVIGIGNDHRRDDGVGPAVARAVAARSLPGVRVRGRIDRLERDPQGRLVVVDVKTGKSPVTKDDAQRHAQLGLYQLAVSAGLLPDGDQPGGGRLVYVGKPTTAGAAEREQTALGPEDAEQWREVKSKLDHLDRG